MGDRSFSVSGSGYVLTTSSSARDVVIVGPTKTDGLLPADLENARCGRPSDATRSDPGNAPHTVVILYCLCGYGTRKDNILRK